MGLDDIPTPEIAWKAGMLSVFLCGLRISSMALIEFPRQQMGSGTPREARAG